MKTHKEEGSVVVEVSEEEEEGAISHMMKEEYDLSETTTNESEKVAVNTVPLELTTIDVNPLAHTNGASNAQDAINVMPNDTLSFSVDYEGAFTDEDETSENLEEDPYDAVILSKYAPPAVLVDRSYSIHRHTRKIADVFDLISNDLAQDFLSKIPDYDRLRIEEGVNQVLTDKDAQGKVVVKMLNPGPVGKDLSVEITYFGEYKGSDEYAHIVFVSTAEEAHISPVEQQSVEYKGGDGQENALMPKGEDDSSPGIGKVVEGSNIEDSYLHMVASAPFPILVHAEGGRIIESSPAWYYMAGVKKSEATNNH